MKTDIHPDYNTIVVPRPYLRGNLSDPLHREERETIEWEDGTTYPVIDVEISSASHPFYTGKQRILDSAGRVEKFNQRFKNFGK